MTAPPLLVFDLDGTLIDSLPDLAAALNRLLAVRGLTELALAEVAPMVGDGTKKLVERAFAARGRTAEPADHDAFVADYTQHATVATRAYPGVEQTLAALSERGWRFAVCTNKTVAATTIVLRSLSLAHWFAAVGGGDSFRAHKPDPAHLRGTIAIAGGGDIERCVMVGDHRNDIAVAKACGVASIFAAWGYGAPAMADGANAIAQRFTELGALAPSLLRE